MQDASIIRKILRVDHSGETAAIAIYNAQIANVKQPDVKAWLQETLAHEINHQSLFHNAMNDFNLRHGFTAKNKNFAKPCRAMSIWRIGGFMLGGLTALLGENGIMICTYAVEKTVHKHLVEQLAFLQQTEPQIAEILEQIMIDEQAHLNHAEMHLHQTTVTKTIGYLIEILTEILIAISTRGDSLILKQILNQRSLETQKKRSM